MATEKLIGMQVCTLILGIPLQIRALSASATEKDA